MKFVVLLLLAVVVLASAQDASMCVVQKCAGLLTQCNKDSSCKSTMDAVHKCGIDSTCQKEALAVSTSDIASALTSCASRCVAPTIASTMGALWGKQNEAGCNIWGIVGCGAAVAAAIVVCGGPEDVPCILAGISMIPACGPCYCSFVGCPRFCPCN
eukprot:TRINITY_DN7409_c0_g1_i1.p1 TRINITY_DN7409_c0_g1~~TRINITY_DN7409_c0_g1_i1.p1  ORF type:complete len:157 (-),score=23.39 TRINITY_DN7409_c0_g1_i1:190-660(-)